MRLLLDTHILLWALEGDPQLPARAEHLIRDANNEVIVSTASLFEIAIKLKIGKLSSQRTIAEITTELTHVLAIQLIPILPRHLDAYQIIPIHDDHRDPFDRLLIATALADNCTLLSVDGKLERYSSLINLIQQTIPTAIRQQLKGDFVQKMEKLNEITRVLR